MPLFYIESGAVQDEQVADKEAEALDGHASDAGYRNYETMVREVGPVEYVIEIDLPKLYAAVESVKGFPVMNVDDPSAYVAQVNGEHFAFYSELAQSIGRKLYHFPK